MSRQVIILKYSDKCYAVFGDTRECKSILSANNAKYNRNLTNPKTKQKSAGWVIKNITVQRLVHELESAKVVVHLNGENMPTVEQGTRDMICEDPAEVMADQWVQGQIGI